MKCIDLLVFVVLIKSATKFIEAKVNKETDKSEDDYISTEKHLNLCPDGGTELMNDILDTLETSFFNLHSTLSFLSRSSSTTLSSVSSTLLTILDPLRNITGSSTDVLSSLSNVLQETFSSITEVVSGLEVETIATTVSGAIKDLLKSLTEVIQIANDVQEQEFDITKKLETNVISITTSVQVMVNTLSVIAEATTKAFGSVSSEVQEAVVCLTLVLGTVLVIVQSVCSSVTCVLSPLQTVLSTLKIFLVTIDGILQGIDDAIQSIAKSVTTSISIVIGVISVTLTRLTSSFNSALDVIQSSTVSGVYNSLEKILSRLSGIPVSDIASSVTSSVVSFTSSLSTVSSSTSGLLSNVAQLGLVFKTLTKLSGSDSAIVTRLLSMLPRVFEAIKLTSNSLASGIGAEVSQAVTKFIGNVEEPLTGILSFVNDVSSTSNFDSIQNFIPDIAKGIQYVAVTIAEITTTISEASTDVRQTVLEAVLAFHFILGLVLYVAQWVLILTTSISMATAETVSENLSQLTILTSDTFEKVSLITATISSSLSLSLSDLITSIAAPVKQLSATVTTTFQSISGVLANIVVNIDQLTSGSQIERPPVGIVNGTEGTVSQILSGLTGSLDSISSKLSSSLSSFTGTLKEVVSSDSVSLKVISNVLVLIVTQITAVSATASQILPSVSEQLSSVFNSISSIVSKLSVLGDVSVSFNVSLSNVSSALRQLIDALSEYSGDLSVLDDPVKNVAKNVQVLISTFTAIFDAAGKAKPEIINKLSDAISPLPYLVCTVIIAVQQVLGAAIASMSVTIGNMTPALQKLILAMSDILQSIVSITAKLTTLLSFAKKDFADIISEISTPLSHFNNLSSSTLSVISGVVANIQVSLGLAHDEL